MLGATFVLWIAGSAVSAQTPHAAEQTLRFTVFSARPVEGVVFVPVAKAPPQQTVFYPTARSPRYDYRGTMPLRFTDTATGVVVAEATIPPEIHDALLLFAAIEPASAGGLRYQISVLDDGAARQGAGGLAIINLSGLALTGKVDGKDVALKAGLNLPLSLAHAAAVHLQTMLKGKPHQSYAGTVELKKNERALLILFPPFYKGSLEVQSRLLVDEPPGLRSPLAGGK